MQKTKGYSIKNPIQFSRKTIYAKNEQSSYLGHDSHTDIITFDYSENMSINAEVYISIDMMNENAKNLSNLLKMRWLG